MIFKLCFALVSAVLVFIILFVLNLYEDYIFPLVFLCSYMSLQLAVAYGILWSLPTNQERIFWEQEKKRGFLIFSKKKN